MILGISRSAPEISLHKEAVKFLGEMKEGQLVRARVLGMVSKTQAQLFMAGQKVVVKTDLPLVQGQEVQLKLTGAKGGYVFRLMMPETQTGTEKQETLPLARLLSGIMALDQLGKKPSGPVKSILQALALKSDRPDPSFLPRLMMDQGLTLEKKMADLLLSQDRPGQAEAMDKLAGKDLKAALLRLFSEETDGASAKLFKSASSALSTFQTVNHQAAETHRLLLPFPIMVADQFTFGQLLVHFGGRGSGKEGEKENQVFQLAFLLNMTALGRLRADFSLLNKAITGRFLLEDQPTCSYVASLMPALRERLSRLDYQVTGLDCQVAPPADLSEDALVRTVAGPEKTGGLDLVI